MNLTKKLLLIAIISMSANVFAKGGDDAGNGGFAYKQSIKILQIATKELEGKIRDSSINDIERFPERRDILLHALSYENLKKWYLWTSYRDGRKLEMDYSVKNKTVTILKPYYQAFAGKTDTELEDASLEVQKRLLHEASHIWGYKEEESEVFAIKFLNTASDDAIRPTGSIEIKNDFCSCLNGKSDIVNSCDKFCAKQPVTDQPIFYANTNPGAPVLAHPKLGNLYNWCSVQLYSDRTTPQCVLNATDGTNTINIPVSINFGSNAFTANIATLAKNRTWILKLIENKTGTGAQSKEVQIRRREPSKPTLGALQVTPINQYTCVSYGGKVDSAGNVIRTSYVRQYYYFPANETPAPMPPANGQSLIVCHDEQLNPGNDSALYDRLELVSSVQMLFDKADSRFIAKPDGKLEINSILEQRLLNEYDTHASVSLFRLITYPNRPIMSPTNSKMPLGFMMVPFLDSETGRSFCPTSSDYQQNENPLMSLIGDYMSDTEGLYFSESEGSLVQDGPVQKTIYATRFVTESILKNYAFYIQNGVKVKADENAFHTKTIYYYWPISPKMDPLTQGSRKLFTVRNPGQLNGSIPTDSNSTYSTDKRIGCIPKGQKQ